jgi:small redox-active disulfide protein 2
MKKLQILGPGCSKCKLLAEQTEAAARELGIPYTLEKVTEIDQMLKLGVMVTPALIVDNVVKVVGKVPSLKELKSLLA